jgi:4'-phosphopantetheinyl transferase EntD
MTTSVQGSSFATLDPAEVERVVRGLAPISSGVAACRADPALLEGLSADERHLVVSASGPRRAEFAAGRTCAHRALAAIGREIPTIGRGPRRQPVWPAGVTGSISHTAEIAVAVAARRTEAVDGLGVDVEVVGVLDDEIRADVLDPAEWSQCEASIDPAEASTAVFCSKEAVFKTLFPRLGREIGFLDAHVDLEDGAGTVDVPILGVSLPVRTARLGPLVVAVTTFAPGL